MVKLVTKILSLSVFIYLSACGLDLDRDYKEEDHALGDEFASSFSTNLGQSEVNSALQVCYAFRSKRIRFRSDRLGNAFSFSFAHTKCDGATSSASLSANLRGEYESRPMNFDLFTTQNFESLVQTDQHGDLSGLCQMLFAGKDVSKTKDAGDSRYVYEFFVGPGADQHRAKITTFKKDSEGVYKSEFSKDIVVYTSELPKIDESTLTTSQIQQARDLAAGRYGMVAKLERRSVCAGSTDGQQEVIVQVSLE